MTANTETLDWDTLHPHTHREQQTKLTTPVTQNVESILENEKIDTILVSYVDGIPFHSWWWALNPRNRWLVEWMKEANLATVIAICNRFISQNEAYWNDRRERNFDWISQTIENRIHDLGYRITGAITFQYTKNESSKRITIPNAIKKID